VAALARRSRLPTATSLTIRPASDKPRIATASAKLSHLSVLAVNDVAAMIVHAPRSATVTSKVRCSGPRPRHANAISVITIAAHPNPSASQPTTDGRNASDIVMKIAASTSSDKFDVNRDLTHQTYPPRTGPTAAALESNLSFREPPTGYRKRSYGHDETSEVSVKAVVFHAVGDIRVDEVPEPEIQNPTDAIVRLTSSAICGTDLHFVRGTMSGMKPGTILGHEGVGVIESLGDDVRNLERGDRVVIPSTIACGTCSYCRAGYYAQCTEANPNGPDAGTAFFGGPELTGPFDGLQADKARIPYANVGLVKLPDEVSDEDAILISDIFPTGYFGADIAEIQPGDTVAVFGCGPVGQFAILSAKLLGAGRILAIDGIEDRLAAARRQGAETIDFNREDPVETIKRLTGGIGVDRAIDAVGVDAERPKQGPAADDAEQLVEAFEREVAANAPETAQQSGSWKPGDAPSQALRWEVEALAKAGTLSIIGVYPPTMETFPIGTAMNKNLTLNMGNCNHRKYIPRLVELVRTGAVVPSAVLSRVEQIEDAIDAYRCFDERRSGWMKVELAPAA
jgi:threonine dehydrogenase-like Zn-dependent dehydrogenase